MVPITDVRNYLIFDFQDWIEIQALIGKMGKDALKRRICERDVAKITLSDVEKAKSLLSTLKMAEVEEISKAASTFFAWVNITVYLLIER